jgi:ATP-dependent Clp protease ATP-binding subunit ClpA
VLSQELEFCLNDAFAKAREARHEFLTVEHLLLSILDTPKVREILPACGADLARLKDSLNEHLDRTTPRLPIGRGSRGAADARLPARPAACGVPRAVVGQEGSRRRQRAHRDLQREAEPRVHLLNRAEVTRLDVVNFVSHGLSKIAEEKTAKEEPGGEGADRDGEGGSALDKYTTNLNQLRRTARSIL